MSAADASSKSIVGDSAAVAIGTALSRISGLGRVLVIPAVFGATAIGDMFLAVNALPQTIFATFGGQALSSMLVPVIVRALDEDPKRADLLGRTALSIVGVVLAALAVLGLVFHRVIANGLAAGIDSSTGAVDIAGTLLLLMLPQVILYGAVSVFVAMQHSRGKFLLPSIASTVENVGLIAIVVLIARAFDDVHLTSSGDTKVLVVLGMGSTLALLLHLSVQAFGAARAGASVTPGRLRREPELQGLRGQARSNLAWTVVFGVRIIAVTIAAGWAGGGGIQALQIGYLLQNLPTALIGYPVAAAILPRLSRRHEGSASIAFGYSSTRDLVAWVLVPTGVGLIALRGALGDVLAIGRFSDDGGSLLIAAAIAGLGIAAASEAAYEIARQATLAFGDMSGFKQSIWIRGFLSLIGIPLMPMFFEGPQLLIALGLVVSVSDAVALLALDRPLRRVAESSRSIAEVLWRAALAAGAATGAQLAVGDLIVDVVPVLRLVILGLTFVAVYVAGAWLLSGRGSMVRAGLRGAQESVVES